MITTQTLKGFRDFLPEQALNRKWLIEKFSESFENFGFDPLETPAMEYEEVLTGKYGEEADKLLYKFVDRGERKVALRYDQTVPTARIVAQYKDIPKPFRRYQIQPVWRAENPQRGRYREFMQCDADIFGSTSALADAEILSVLYATLKHIGFSDFTILYNDRSLFAGIPAKAILVVDKLDKIGKDGVQKELEEKGFDKTILEKIERNKETEYIKQVSQYSHDLGVSKESLVFSPTLARGLDYYTSTIFEVRINGYTAGSVCGGGRYDNLIGLFTGENVPAVGFAFGFDRVLDAAKELGILPVVKTATKILVSIFSKDDLKQVLDLTTALRNKGFQTEVFPDTTAKLDKQLKYADKKGIPFVAILGPDEIKNGTVTLKNLKTKAQETIKIDSLPDVLNHSK